VPQDQLDIVGVGLATLDVLIRCEQGADVARGLAFEDFTVEDFIQLAILAPEIIVLGTGAKQHFPDYDLLQPLINKQIGLEVMATDAACRTYNILMSEGRRVAAALLMIRD
jgi:uncharacterized protein